MAKWIKIHGDREWRTPKLINEDNITIIRLYEHARWLEIVYRVGIFSKTFIIKESKDSEYEYFRNLSKN